MGKRSRQRQKNQTAGRDNRDNAVRFTLRQLLLMLGKLLLMLGFQPGYEFALIKMMHLKGAEMNTVGCVVGYID